MIFRQENFGMMLSGSHVDFKKRERPVISEEESELKLKNERKLQGGIEILRKLRTAALEESDFIGCQNILNKAHQLSAQMAEQIMNQALSDKPFPIDVSFLETIQKARSEYAEKDAGSGHYLPPQFSVTNLFRATDDMLVRLEEKAKSITAPDHKLSEDEMKYVLQEFLRGTNDLTINVIEKFFKKGTKVGGILSGGSVYVELVKKVVEKYGDSSFAVDSFVIAVDKQNNKVVFEASETDFVTLSVMVTDDMIDKGGTVITALWAAGEQFPNATIYSGMGTDQAGGFEERRIKKHVGHLFGLFQDFANLSEEKRDDEALTIFKKAQDYATENNVTLPPGWYKVKRRIEKRMKK